MKSRLVFFLVVQPKLTLHGVAFSGLNGLLVLMVLCLMLKAVRHNILSRHVLI